MRLSDAQVAARGGWSECPYRSGLRRWVLDEETGAPTSSPKNMACGSNRCPFCLVTNIWKTSVAIGHSAPSRYAVLTGVPTDDWSVNRLKLKLLWRALERGEVRAGRRELLLRAWYCFEVNPAGTGFHLNLWWWGPDVPQSRLSEISASIGWGSVVHVQRYRSADVSYGMKEARNYGLKELDSSQPHGRRLLLTEAQDDYLARNGGHLMGARRGKASPWRDGVKGDRVKGRREALAAYFAGRALPESVVTRRGDIPGSVPFVDPYVAPEASGRWSRVAPGRSEWAWGPREVEGQETLSV